MEVTKGKRGVRGGEGKVGKCMWGGGGWEKPTKGRKIRDKCWIGKEKGRLREKEKVNGEVLLMGVKKGKFFYYGYGEVLFMVWVKKGKSGLGYRKEALVRLTKEKKTRKWSEVYLSGGRKRKGGDRTEEGKEREVCEGKGGRWKKNT